MSATTPTAPDPNVVRAATSIGHLAAAARGLNERGQFGAALSLIEGLTRTDEYLELIFLRGKILQTMGRHAEAADTFERLLTLAPEHPARYNLVNALANIPDQATRMMDHARRWLAIKPTSAVTHFNLGVGLLRSKQYDAGWSEFVWRLKIPAPYRSLRPFAHPFWDGGHPDGRILYLPELDWGIGLDLMAASLLDDFNAIGTSVVMEVHEKLVSPLSRSFPQFEFVARQDPPHPSLMRTDIAAQAYFGQAGGMFRRSVADFERQRPFIRPRMAAPRETRARPRIGIAWHTTNPQHGAMRSIDLSDWEPILKAPNADFVALQYGDVHDEIERANRSFGCAIEHPKADYFYDIEGFIEALDTVDLVVSVDNSTVHFAGALGKSCWALLPPTPFFLWHASGRESDWYPSVELIRSDDRSWKANLVEIAHDLSEWIASHRSIHGAS